MTDLNNDIINQVLRTIRALNSMHAPVTGSSTPGETAQPANPLQQLQPGQQISASVLKASADGQVLLRLLSQTLTAETGVELKAGQKLLLEVVQNSGVLQLKILTLPSKADIQAQYLKISLPQQTALSQLTQQLSQHLTSAADTTSAALKLDSTTITSVRQLLDLLPQARSIAEPGKLQQLMLDSGLFLENRLAQGQPPANDLKAALLSLAQRIRAQLPANRPVANTPTATPANARGVPQQNLATLIAQPVQPATASPMPAAAPTLATAAPAATAPATHRPGVTPGNGAQQPTQAAANPPGNTEVANQRHDLDIRTATLLFKPGQAAFTTAQQADNAAGLNLQAAINNLTAQTIQLPRFEFSVFAQLLLGKSLGNLAKRADFSSLQARHAELQQLLRSVESGIARIVTQQLASVPQEDATRLVWQFELPIRYDKEISDFLFRIEQDEPDEQNPLQQAGWTVRINFDIGSSGRIHSKLHLAGDVLATHFWAEKETTVAKIKAHLPRLEKAIERIGLKSSHMGASNCKPPDPIELFSTDRSLLDENA
ncbi:MAG: flagellar hook-length control protein FliK [Chromatiales bacterium]|jgi:hypothetical protein